MKKELAFYHRIWREGKYIDLWNLPHFLISLLLGITFIYLGLTFFTSIILIILIKTVWEIYEHKYVIKEAIPNKILDVVTGVLGVLFAFYLNKTSLINPPVFLFILLLELVFGTWGLYSARKLKLYI
jgi:hypothetical protein